MVVDPMKRLSPAQLLKNPWILGDVTPQKGENVLSKMREWKSKSKLKE